EIVPDWKQAGVIAVILREDRIQLRPRPLLFEECRAQHDNSESAVREAVVDPFAERCSQMKLEFIEPDAISDGDESVRQRACYRILVFTGVAYEEFPVHFHRPPFVQSPCT